MEPPSHKVLRPSRLKILQNSSDGVANATNNATGIASQPEPPLELREVKGNLTCAQPGCAADVLLQVYDPQKDWGEKSCPQILTIFVPYSGDLFSRRVAVR